MTMRDKRRIEGDILNIYAKYGYNQFQWSDIKDIVENSPVYFRNSSGLKCMGKVDGCKVYQVNPAFFERNSERQYNVKKSPIYPKKTWLASGVIG